MIASTLRKPLNTITNTFARKGTSSECVDELPRRSTRELEAVFANGEKRRPLMGLTLALTLSAGLWAAIAALVF